MVQKACIPKEQLVYQYEKLRKQRKVAEYFGVCYQTINKLCREYGIKPHKREYFKLSSVDKDELIELYREKTIQEIADLYNVSNTAVRTALTKAGIPFDKSKGKGIEITPEMRDVIIGSILGDGHICKRSLEISHSAKQKEYLLYKRKLLKPLCSDTIYPRKSNRKVTSYRFRTMHIPEIGEIWRKWYNDKTKTVPSDVRDSLNPLAVAIWYMDDGCKRSKGTARIATSCFTQEEVANLSDFLNERYNLTTKVVVETGYYNIYIPSKSFRLFNEIIEGYVPGCMSYKLLEV